MIQKLNRETNSGSLQNVDSRWTLVFTLHLENTVPVSWSLWGLRRRGLRLIYILTYTWLRFDNEGLEGSRVSREPSTRSWRLPEQDIESSEVTRPLPWTWHRVYYRVWIDSDEGKEEWRDVKDCWWEFQFRPSSTETGNVRKEPLRPISHIITYLLWRTHIYSP